MVVFQSSLPAFFRMRGIFSEIWIDKCLKNYSAEV